MSASSAPFVRPGVGGPPGPRHAWRTEALATLVDAMAPAGAVLDAGCGRGTCGRLLARLGRPVVAFDPDPGLRAPLRADCTALPFPGGAFAGAIMGEVLEHLDDDIAALVEAARVLVPGGVVAVTVPAGPTRMGTLDVLVGHRRRYTRAGLADALRSAGLAVELLRGWGWPFGRAYDLLAPRALLAGRALPEGAAWRASAGMWQALFRLDALLDAGDRGSGLIAVARRP